jgi:O-antigen/teichoic acid export membrane protein
MGFKELRDRIKGQWRSKLAKNATWMLSGQGIQVAVQFTYFMLVARALGPHGYGTFVACTAFSAVLAPFSPCGTGQVLIKYVSRNKEVFPQYFGNALLVTACSGAVLVGFVLAARTLLLPGSADFSMVLAVAIADLVCAQVTFVCCQSFLATDRGSRSAQILIVSAALRLAAALTLLTGARTTTHWAFLYLSASVLGVIWAVSVVSVRCARPRLEWRLIFPSMREGFHFTTSVAAQSVYNDIDKMMLARLSSVESAAIYAVAYRFVEGAMLPIRSLQAVTFAEFFRRGVNGVTPAFDFARKILRRAIPYGIASSLLLLGVAQLLPTVLGRDYTASRSALCWLCLLPVIKSVHSFLTDTLTGADYQWQRSLSQISVAVFNVVINLWLIRVWSWRGAAWSSLLTDFLLVVILYFVIRAHLRKERMTTNSEFAEVLSGGTF